MFGSSLADTEFRGHDPQGKRAAEKSSPEKDSPNEAHRIKLTGKKTHLKTDKYGGKLTRLLTSVEESSLTNYDDQYFKFIIRGTTLGLKS